MGLGDTNYDQFCHMGKIIDKRLKELGGNRFHPLCCADEATGLEETVERWKEEIMDLLCQLDELIAVAAAKTALAPEVVPDAQAETLVSVIPPVEILSAEVTKIAISLAAPLTDMTQNPVAEVI